MANLVAMLRLPSNLKSTQWQVLAGPVLILLILSMMVLPLPAFVLDLLFTFNIALSIMVLLVAMFTQRTLEFAAFPTILLFTTLLRLALNVASTRIILMEGHTGAAAAGKVVYVGNQLRGYGNLVMIKHDEDYITAYAHNDKLMVNNGQNVKIGQQIATMGNSDADSVRLHFQIRYRATAIDPLRYLPPQGSKPKC